MSFHYKFQLNWFYFAVALFFLCDPLSAQKVGGIKGKIISALKNIFNSETLFLQFGFFKSLNYSGGPNEKYYRLLTPFPKEIYFKSAKIDILSRLKKGGLWYENFVIQLKECRFAGMQLPVVEYTFHNVLFLLQNGILKIKHLEKVEVSAISMEQEINKFLGQLMRGTRVSRARMQIKESEIIASGIVHFKPIKMRFQTGGKSIIGKTGATLNFAPRYLKLNGFSVPSFVKKRIFKKVNPVIDFRIFHVNAHIHGIYLKKGQMKTHLSLKKWKQNRRL
ncbi:hypothetical protein ACFL35_09725 [Candidatus Riflebacteria bacterium]